jgi:hypothetical protein
MITRIQPTPSFHPRRRKESNGGSNGDVTAEEERYDLSKDVALDLTSEASTGVQSVAGIQKCA